MKCTKCGAEVEEQRAFCNACGQRVVQEEITGAGKAVTNATAQPEGKPTAEGESPSGAATPVTQTASTAVSGASASPPAQRSNLKTLGILIGAVIVLLLGLGGVWAFKGSLPVLGDFPFPALLDTLALTPEHEMDELVPASADIYIHAGVSTELDQVKKLQALWQLFPEAETWEENLKEELASGDGDEDAEEVIGWDDVQAWLGDYAGIFMDLEGVNLNDSETPFVGGIIAEIADHKAVDDFLDKWVAKATKDREEDDDAPQVSERQYKGIKIIATVDDEEETEDTFVAVIGDYFVMTSTEELIKQIIHNHRDDGEYLAQNEKYQQVKAELPQDSLGQLYMDMGSYMQLIGESMDTPQLGTAALGEDFWNDYAEMLGYMGGVLVAEDEGIRIKMSVQTDNEKAEELGLAAQMPSFTPALVEQVPADAVFYMESYSIKQYVDSLIQQLGVTDADAIDQINQFKDMLKKDPYNFDVDTELLDLLDGPYAMGFWAGEQVPTLTLLFAVSDTAQMQKNIDKGLDLLTDEIIQSSIPAGRQVTEAEIAAAKAMFPDLVVSEPYAGATVWTINPLILAEVPDYPVDYLNLAYALTDDLLIICSDVSGIHASLDVIAGTADSLADDATYQKLTEGIPGDLFSFGYMSREATMQMVENIMIIAKDMLVQQMQAIREQYGESENFILESMTTSLDDMDAQLAKLEEINAQIEPLKGMVIYSVADGDVQTSDIYIQIRE
ncbi:MAG TPA: DUF3352 domain-containing protein [bacterium]|nr:DUF3352 domain-containing protein [bacterium]